MPVDYNKLFVTLKDGVINIAQKTLPEYFNDAVNDGNETITILENHLKDYSQMLLNGEIDEDNFKSLIMGENDLLKMTALTQAGLTAIRIDKFKNEIFTLITNTILGITGSD